jgi:hypothetical protein
MPRTARLSDSAKNRQAFLEKVGLPDPEEALVAEKLMEWARQYHYVQPDFTAPEGEAAESFRVNVEFKPGGYVHAFAVSAMKRCVFLLGRSLRGVPPFASADGYAELLRRAHAVPRMRPAEKNQYPNVTLGDLRELTTLAALIRFMDWAVSEVRGRAEDVYRSLRP